MPHRRPVRPRKTRSSYGHHLLDHLAAHGTGLTGAQIAVVALLEVDADLPWCASSILSWLLLGTFFAVFGQFSDEFVENPHTLPVGLVGPGGDLVSAVFVHLGTDLNALHKGQQGIPVQLLQVGVLLGQLKKAGVIVRRFLDGIGGAQLLQRGFQPGGLLL